MFSRERGVRILDIKSRSKIDREKTKRKIREEGRNEVIWSKIVKLG